MGWQANASFLEWHRLYLSLESALPILDQCELFVQQEYRCPPPPPPSCLTPLLTGWTDRDARDVAYVQSLLSGCNVQVIRNCFHALSAALDFSLGRELGGVLTVRQGFSAELDRLR